MIHAEMINTSDCGPRPSARESFCAGELVHLRSTFHSDVSWQVYLCQRCGKQIYTVGGGRHWWNYEKQGEQP